MQASSTVAEFDPYFNWLDIPVHERPPSHYRLLDLRPGESDAATIEVAADRTTAIVRQFASGDAAAWCEKLLVEMVLPVPACLTQIAEQPTTQSLPRSESF